MSLSISKYIASILPEAVEKRIPLSGQFEITARCNLGCKMCYIARPFSGYDPVNDELPASDWIKIAEQARDAGMIRLLLTGGEVFVRKDFKFLLQTLKEMGFMIKIYSNGTLITRETASWLGRMKPLEMEVTLYGASAETYGKVTGNPNAFSLAVRGIDNLVSEGVSLQLRTTVVRDNYQDFHGIARIAEERDLELGIVNYIKPARNGTGRISQSLRLPADLQIEYDNMVERYFAEKKLEKGYNPDQEECTVDLSGSELLDPEDAYRCLAGKTDFWITWKGEMSPCASIYETGIYPLKTGFDIAWRMVRELCETTPVCPDCLECPYQKRCLACPPRLMLETGSYDKPAEYLCQLAKGRKPVRA